MYRTSWSQPTTTEIESVVPKRPAVRPTTLKKRSRPGVISRDLGTGLPRVMTAPSSSSTDRGSGRIASIETGGGESQFTRVSFTGRRFQPPVSVWVKTVPAQPFPDGGSLPPTPANTVLKLSPSVSPTRLPDMYPWTLGSAPSGTTIRVREVSRPSKSRNAPSNFILGGISKIVESPVSSGSGRRGCPGAGSSTIQSPTVMS